MIAYVMMTMDSEIHQRLTSQPLAFINCVTLGKLLDISEFQSLNQ